MKRVALEHFRENALRLVARVRRTGEPIVIARSGDDVARLVPERVSLRHWMLELLGFGPKRRKRVNRYVSWGIYLKMR